MKNKQTKLNRRKFLAASASAISAPLFLPGSIFGYNGGVAPSNKLTTAFVGIGNRGGELLGGFLHNSNYQIVAVCDCWKERVDRAAGRVNNHYKNDAVAKFHRYEDLLADRDDVDVIVCATPDHWHTKIAIETCMAGKDIYCEKPLTLTIEESRLIVKAARKYNRVCTGGSQRVMEDYGYMAPILQSGAIGEVKEVYCGLGNPPKYCYLPEQPIPEGLDWDRWQGQAPVAPFNSERCSGNYGGGWRNYGEYCTGFLADWGAHKFGGAMYCLGVDKEEPVELYPAGYEGSEYVCAVFKNGVRFYHAWNGPHDVTFKGTEGEYRHHQTKMNPIKTVDVRRYSGGARNIADDFAFCVRNRLRPFQDFEYAAATATLCQMMAICHKVKRPLKWDAEKMVFVGDQEATRMVSRVQRYPYTIPEV